MPILEMHLMTGRTNEQKSNAAKAVTEALVDTLGVKRESVRVLITEHGPNDFFVSGITMAQRNDTQHAAQQKQIANAEGE